MEDATGRDRARAVLAPELEDITGQGLPARERIAVAGRAGVHRAILEAAKEEGASLILIGPRGRGFLGEFFLGSVSAKVLEEAVTHVLITHFRDPHLRQEVAADRPVVAPGPPATPREGLFSRILVPVDFSPPSMEIIDFIHGLPPARREVIVLHVIGSVGDREDLRARMAGTYQKLQALQEDLGNGLQHGKILIRFGDPAREICRMAAEEEATLIIISRFGARDYTRNVLVGSTAAEVARRSGVPVLVRYPSLALEVTARELRKDELDLAGKVWESYHQQKADAGRDRIFGVFVENTLTTVARCRRHADGLEVDGVFTLPEFRGRGYARLAVETLVRGCGQEPLFMHSTLELVDFYKNFGFVPIPESGLPKEIRERFNFALGNLQGSDVQPMKREPGP
jgi:nucleotide-binding universal stress UspA family protein/GNAT superfamily N-acetyltransferase